MSGLLPLGEVFVNFTTSAWFERNPEQTDLDDIFTKACYEAFPNISDNDSDDEDAIVTRITNVLRRIAPEQLEGNSEKEILYALRKGIREALACMKKEKEEGVNY